MARSTTKVRELAPERLYPLRAFQEASGIAATRMREARWRGLELTTLEIGKRKFVRGSDGIAYIEALAKLGQASEETK